MTGLVAAVALAVAPSAASAAACPSSNTSYTGNCGPTFTMPNWTDAGGWTDPSKYSTIQLADVNGDGRDELIARNDDGVEIWEFDTTFGQWRPQVDANGQPQVLTDFASPSPSDEGASCNMRNPEYYTTIQAADIDGQPGAEILGRFCDGMRVYKYSPPAGGRSIDGGTWQRIGTGGPFSDAEGYTDPSLYSTIHVAQFTKGTPPVMFARQSSSPGQPSLVYFIWLDGGWAEVSDPNHTIAGYSDQECGDPACYLDFLTGNVSPSVAGQLSDLVGRNKFGLWAFSGDPSTDWTLVGGSPGVGGSLADVPSADCPFSTSGASGPASGDCLGSSPSYYETLRAANIDGVAGDELLARASDGLRVRSLTAGSSKFASGGTLTALAGAPSALQPGQWASIRTGDVDGNGRQEVLALDGQGLQAWSYDPQFGWGELRPNTPLELGADPWLSHPEYYSTLQVGDVDGNGTDDVVVRGPFGIRTWFYNLRGGGWFRYLPDGYPAFPTAGQQAAFAALNTLASAQRVIPDVATSVRDVWTGLYPPSVSALSTLQTALASIAQCTGLSPGPPPQYQLCTPPAGSSGFTAADWTAVVNQMLSESSDASVVVKFFGQLQRLRGELSIADNSQLPDLQQDLGMPEAAGQTATFDASRLWSLTAEIAGQVASTASSPATRAPVSVASDLLSAFVAASPTAMSSFSTTYDGGLQGQFAQMASEVDSASMAESQYVRGDAGLLGLVAQLVRRGTWALDPNGIESAATQGFAIWAYQELTPALYDRYDITSCADDLWGTYDTCEGISAGPGVIGGGTSFTTIANRFGKPPPVGPPCTYGANTPVDCHFVAPPSGLMSLIWGPVTSDCVYYPGNPQTQWWTYGCSAGVDIRTSIGANSWKFRSLSGDFVVEGPAPPSATTAAAPRHPALSITLGRPRRGRQPAERAHASLRADVRVPPRLRLAGATVTLERLLFDRGGEGELTRIHGVRAPRPQRLRRSASGSFTAATSGRLRIRVALRRLDRDARVALSLGISGPPLRAPRVCRALPAATALDTPSFELESRLRIAHGRTHRVLRVRYPLRCVRDTRGNISRLVSVRPRHDPARGGLALTLRGPARVRSGETVRYVARVHNRRHGGRLRSSLWHVALIAPGGRVVRVARLRPGRSGALTFARTVPRRAGRRFCVDVGASAPGARPARARACAAVGVTPRPRVTG